MDLSQPSGTKRHVVIAVLVLVIAGAIGLVVWGLTRDTSAEGERDGDKRTYFCDKCCKMFTLDREDHSAWVLDHEITAADAGASHRPHCPLCKAKHSGWMIDTCPKCGKSYMAAAGGRPKAAMPNGMVMAEAGNICPYCKGDITR